MGDSATKSAWCCGYSFTGYDTERGKRLARGGSCDDDAASPEERTEAAEPSLDELGSCARFSSTADSVSSRASGSTSGAMTLTLDSGDGSAGDAL